MPGFADAISYHPSGMVFQTVHSNGVTDTRALDSSGMARPRSIATSGTDTHWLVTDHLGTPFMMNDGAANVVWQVDYEPYGQVWSLRLGSDLHQPLRLPGQEAEQLNIGLNGATERYYNVHRWYRSRWGRYTQSDPVGLRGGLNLYSYAHQNPFRFIDLLGLTTYLGFGEH
ncbi:MAG: RHS repeat-associated core domain-containing protein, partial [Acidimicrobiia bacterium]